MNSFFAATFPTPPAGHLTRWSIDFEMAKVTRHWPRLRNNLSTHVARLGKKLDHTVDGSEIR